MVDGKPTWWKAKAGAAITANVSAETNAAAKTFFSSPNPNLLWSLRCGSTYGR